MIVNANTPGWKDSGENICEQKRSMKRLLGMVVLNRPRQPCPPFGNPVNYLRPAAGPWRRPRRERMTVEAAIPVQSVNSRYQWLLKTTVPLVFLAVRLLDQDMQTLTGFWWILTRKVRR